MFSSCCPTKATKYDKRHWDEEIEKAYEFPPRPISKAEIKYISEIKNEVAIFDKEYSMLSSKDFERMYTPSIPDLIQAEKILDIYAKNNNISPDNLKKYNKRQYLGYYSIEGKKILLINFLTIENNCQQKSENAYLFDKYFLDLLHPNEFEERRRIELPLN